MNHTTLEKIISETQSSPYIKWNDESLADLIRYEMSIMFLFLIRTEIMDTFLYYII